VIVSSFCGHAVRNGSGAASSEKLQDERMGSDGTGHIQAMGLDAFIDAQLYMRSMRQCDDSLSEKKMHFCFNHPRNPNAGLRSQKI
jgi:hypothetical protein